MSASDRIFLIIFYALVIAGMGALLWLGLTQS